MTDCFTLKDGAGKQLDQDFDGKEYLLQDAEMKYWTISLSVKKVEKEEFLNDIRSTEPGHTYILSYVTPRGVRHAVFAESCDHTRVNCLNSWGDNNPTPRIPINTKGNIFYRVSCTTFSSTSDSAEKLADCWLLMLAASGDGFWPAKHLMTCPCY